MNPRLPLPIAPWLAVVALIVTPGCLSQSYEISRGELSRLVQLPPEERGRELHVTQQSLLGADIDSAELETMHSHDPYGPSVLLWGDARGHHHGHGHRHGHRHSRSASSPRTSDSAEDALVVVAVVAAVAATAAVTASATEGARFVGSVRVPHDQPVLLVKKDGQKRWHSLDDLSEADVGSARRAAVSATGSGVLRLRRAPLDRVGFVYQMELGAAAVEPSRGPALGGLSGRASLGYMPSQRVGLLMGASFAVGGSARGAITPEAGAHGERDQMVEYRSFLQAEWWPVALGRLHLGPYLEVGRAWSLRDSGPVERSARGAFAAAGVGLQIDWTTRLAATLRGGLAYLPALDVDARGPFGTEGRRLAPSVTLGVSIY